jgi:hypothetical protein
MMMEITHNHKSESKIPRDVRYPVHDWKFKFIGLLWKCPIIIYSYLLPRGL